MRCPECGAVYPAEYAYCVNCGQALESPTPSRPAMSTWRRLRRAGMIVLLSIISVGTIVGVLLLLRSRAPTASGQLAYLVRSDNQISLWLATAEHTATLKMFGGADEISYLTLAGGVGPTPFLRGGKALLFVARSGVTYSLYRLEVDAPTPLLLAEEEGEIRGTFSADGHRIVLSVLGSDGDARVLLVDAQGTEPHKVLARGEAVDYELSPRGDLLLVKVSRASQTHLDVVDMEGRTTAVLAHGDADAWATFSPDGSQLLSWTTGLTQPVGTLAIAPSSRPEEKTGLLAINAQRGGFLDSGNAIWLDCLDGHGHSLWLMDLRTGRRAQLSAGAADLWVYRAGKSDLFFALQVGGHHDLYAAKSNGEQLRFWARRIAPESVVPSPSGRIVAFAEREDGQLLYRLSSGELLRLPKARAGSLPCFSAHERWLAFEEARGDENLLWISHPDGSERRLIARCGYAPVWSR